jgi:hypothetical protein
MKPLNILIIFVKFSKIYFLFNQILFVYVLANLRLILVKNVKIDKKNSIPLIRNMKFSLKKIL